MKWENNMSIHKLLTFHQNKTEKRQNNYYIGVQCEIKHNFIRAFSIICQDACYAFNNKIHCFIKKIHVFRVQYCRKSITKPSYNKVILLVPALYISLFFSWSQGPRYNEVPLYMGHTTSLIVLCAEISLIKIKWTYLLVRKTLKLTFKDISHEIYFVKLHRVHANPSNDNFRPHGKH